MGVDMQFRIYELERLAKVPHKFKYPLFETYHWYAAKHFYDKLRKYNHLNSSAINPILQQASESIVYNMNRWLTIDKRYQIRNRYIIPKGINCEKLLRDLSRELELAKTRCGSSNQETLPSKTTITSSNKIVPPIDNKREFIQFGDNKINVKCRRLSPVSEAKESIVGHEVKIATKSKIDEDRKGNLLGKIQKKKFGRPLSSVKQKNNSSEPGNSSRISYKLDLKAKRQHFTQNSHVQSLKNRKETKNDMNNSLKSAKIPVVDIESHDTTARLFNITPDGLASFVAKSVIDKSINIKQEHQSLKQKLSSLNKSKFKSSDIDKKCTKKLKIEFKKPSTSTNASEILPSIISQAALPTKKPVLPSTPIPKKVNSADRLGKILKIADSIKSRGGILT
ncbi:unnamed protein product [Rotaria magnacalcarata]|nr:unnamed protein product [Rotaria magnacalcarata]